MARNNVSVKQLAEKLQVRPATVSDKIHGRSRFFCDEAMSIKAEFFPYCSVEYLFDQNVQIIEK